MKSSTRRKHNAEQETAPMDVREAGRKGGLTRATQHEGTVEDGKMSIEEAGRKGGSTVAQKYGPDYFKNIGRMGGQARGAIGDVEVITEQFLNGQSEELGIPKVTPKFLQLVQQYTGKVQKYRVICREFVDEAWKNLQGRGFDTEELRPFARSILEGCCQRIGWGDRTIEMAMPEILKNEARALAGQKGALVANERRSAATTAAQFASSGSADDSDSPAQKAAYRISLPYSEEVREMVLKAVAVADEKGAKSLVYVVRDGKVEAVEAQ